MKISATPPRNMIAEQPFKAGINAVNTPREDRGTTYVTTNMPMSSIELIPRQLSSLSAGQLENMLIAANLLVTAWQMNTPAYFNGSSVRPSASDGKQLCL
jgi:hypothetical protein